MELWRPATLGHRSVPIVWASYPGKEYSSKILGDLHKTPASVQVYNAYMYDKLRERSNDCGLGLAQLSHHNQQRRLLRAKSDCSLSLRKYADFRLEQEKGLDDRIQNATDVSKLCWEASMAHAAQQYVLAAVLLRRASELDSADACGTLSKMFGFGICQSNVLLFERDTLRGIAWAIRALQLLVFDMERCATDQSLQLLNHMLHLLCTLMCAPESLQSVQVHDARADVSMPLLLLFPRSCELLHPDARLKNTIPNELTRESFWTALRDVLCKVKAIPSLYTNAEPADSVSIEQHISHVLAHTLFLESFLLMRMAVLERENAYLHETYHTCTQYLLSTRQERELDTFAQLRSVASEIQQWAAPDVERIPNTIFDGADFLAMRHRVSNIFVFTSRPLKEKSPNVLDGRTNQPRLKEKQEPRSYRTHGTVNALETTLQYIPRLTPSNASSAASKDHALSHKTQRYSGITTSKLRDVSTGMSRRSVSADHAKIQQHSGKTMTADDVSYLCRMDEPLQPRLRRRPSSIVSVTHSHACPTNGSAGTPAPTTADTTPISLHLRTVSPTLTPPLPDSAHLRMKLRRQSSQNSLRRKDGLQSGS